MTKFVGIISAKGGVGKTTTTINLSSALHFFNRQVIAVDANFVNPDLGIHLGMPRPDKNLHTALKGEHDIKDSVYRHKSGLMVVPGSISYYDAKNVRRDKLLEMIYGLIGTAEIVIIDSSPGLGRDARAVVSACDFVIIVTTADLVSVSSSLKMVHLAKEIGRQVLGVIVNKHQSEGFELRQENIAEFLGVPVLGVIPDEREVGRTMHTRGPIVLADPLAKSSIAFKKAAAQLIGEKYVEELAKKEEKSVFSQVMENLGFKRFK